MLGIFNLRGPIIPVIDLKKLFRIASDSTPLTIKKVGIVEHEGASIGFLFDRTGDVFRHRPDEKSEFHYDSPRSPESVISGAIKLDGGKRIVQILDAFSLIHLEIVPSSEKGGRQRKQQSLRQQCISFQVGMSRCAFGMEAIHEILRVPVLSRSALTSGYCMGMFELRGDMVPVIHFAALLCAETKNDELSVMPPAHDDQRIIVLKMGDEKFGLFVVSVESILTYTAEELLKFPLLQKTRLSLFSGCISRPSGGEVLLLNHAEVLSGEEI